MSEFYRRENRTPDLSEVSYVYQAKDYCFAERLTWAERSAKQQLEFDAYAMYLDALI